MILDDTMQCYKPQGHQFKSKQGHLPEQKSFVPNSTLLAHVKCFKVLNLDLRGCDYIIKHTTQFGTSNDKPCPHNSREHSSKYRVAEQFNFLIISTATATNTPGI